MKAKIPGELEMQVLDILWQCGNCSISDVFEKLKIKRKIAYTTVATILHRLTLKGMLYRSTQDKINIFHHVKTKDRFVAETIHKTIRQYIKTFGNVALVHFVEEAKKIDKKKLKKIIDKIENGYK